MAHLLHRIGAFAVRRRRTVLVGWLLTFAVLAGLAMGFKGTFSSEFTIPGTESQQAAELIAKRIPGTDADAATGKVVFAAPAGQTLQTAEHKAAVQQTVKALGQVSSVASATDPYTAKTISEDGRIAYTDLTFTVAPRAVTATSTDAIASAT
jgi:putative drug exporter of the RND superfamily